MKKIVALSLAVVSVFAFSVKGIGYGETKKDSKKEALADLSSSISTEVKSYYKKVNEKSGQGVVTMGEKRVETFSHLPLIGVEFGIYKKGEEYVTEAIIDSYRTLAMYESRLKDLQKSIKKNYAYLKTEKLSKIRQMEVLDSLLKEVSTFERYKVVAKFFGSGENDTIEVTEAEIKEKLLGLQTSADSLRFASKVLTRDLDQKNIFVYPVTTKESREVTQFSSVLRDEAARLVDSTKNVKNADYVLTGNYDILKNSIIVTYTLLDKTFKEVKTNMIEITKPAYEKLNFQPTVLSFDKLLNNNMIVSSKFNVQINTNKGNENLLFKKGEIINLYAKMNQVGYFYLVGHTLHKNKKYSYLVELNEASGNQKFIRYVDGDEINRWIDLGEFEVGAPFGVESLQMIASTKNLVNAVPSYDFSSAYELYLLSSSDKAPLMPEASLQSVRAIMKKKNKKAQKAEAVLLFTTMEK